MTDIASSGPLKGIARVLVHPISVAGRTLFKVLAAEPFSEQQKKDFAQFAKIAAENTANAAKAMRDAEASRKLESNETYLPNISTLTPDTAKTTLAGIEASKQMNWIQGTTIHGNNGDRATSSLETYVCWLKDFISSFDDAALQNQPAVTSGAGTQIQAAATSGETADTTKIESVILPNVSSLSRSSAASVYKQVQNLIDTNQLEGRRLVARNGETSTQSVDTYLSWLADKAGVNQAA